ncbi:hypothetical protein FHR58_002874 [Xanthomonas arboricola]|nr:hypothetical protein [Xanthomonas arboricola]
MRVRSEASCHGWKQHAGTTGMAACLPPSVISHMRVGFAPVPSPQAPLRATARACGAGAPRHARPWRAICASSPRRKRGFGQLRHDRVQHFSKSRQLEVAATTCRGGSVAGDWRRAAQGCAAAASQTGCLTEPKSRFPAALTLLPKPVPTGSLLCRTLTPTPALRPGLRRGRSKARAPMARQLCLLAPTRERLSSSLPALLLSSRLSNLTPPAAPAPGPPADRRCARCRSTAAPCLR